MRHSEGIAVILLFLVLTGLSFIGGASCATYVLGDAKIIYFKPASGVYYPGGAVESLLRFQNVGKTLKNFWVGYSVWNPIGQRYDIASHQVVLAAQTESSMQSKVWYVPEYTSCISGDYKLAMAVWNAPPEGEKAIQVAYREKENAFLVLRRFDQFDVYDTAVWRKSNHRLEKSYLAPHNVSLDNGSVRIKVTAGALDGGEFGTIDDVSYGTYRARIQVPPLTGLVTGFFLYHGIGGGGDEIDIELYHDGNWQIAFTTWLEGTMTNTVKKALSFDPSAGYHEYRIDFYPGRVSFFVDGNFLQDFTSGLPQEAMRLLVNTWFPDWLEGAAPMTDHYTYVDWIQF